MREIFLPLQSGGAMFEVNERQVSDTSNTTIIKIIGVGGAGGNAVDHMIREGMRGVEFIVIDTDEQALKRSVTPWKLHLGKTGLGVDGKPEVGRDAAISEREQIVKALKGVHMVFIVTGMGSGTGTDAMPVIAKVAREMDIFTVAVVTRPFVFEGKRTKIAVVGIIELLEHIDFPIVISSNHLGNGLSMDEAFKATNDAIRQAVGSIAGSFAQQCAVSVDYEDLMYQSGYALMAYAGASGVERARIAIEQALASPLLKDIKLSDATGVLLIITSTRELRMKEVNKITSIVREHAAEDSRIIFGTIFDEDMGGELRVTLFVTGLWSI
jgi:cell division protein FtsZ